MAKNSNWFTTSAPKIVFVAAAAGLLTTGCAFRGPTSYSDDTPERRVERQALLERIEQDQTNLNELALDAASREASGKVVIATCQAADQHPAKRYTCTQMLKSYFTMFAARNDHTPNEQALLSIGHNLVQQGGQFDCSINDQSIVCDPTTRPSKAKATINPPASVAAAKTKAPDTHKQAARKTRNQHVLNLSALNVVSGQSLTAFSFGGISPSKDKGLLLNEDLHAPSISGMFNERLLSHATVAPLASPSQQTLRAPINTENANIAAAEKPAQNWAPFALGATVLSAAGWRWFPSRRNRKQGPETATKAQGNPKTNSNSLARTLATVWGNRQIIRHELSKKMGSILLGGAAGAGARMGAKFILAKAAITLPVAAAGSTGFASLLPTVGLLAASAIVAGAIGGATGQVTKDWYNHEFGKEVGMRRKAARMWQSVRTGASSGAISGLIGGVAADMFMTDGILHEYVGKPVAEVVGERVRGFFSSVHNAITSLFEPAAFKPHLSDVVPVETPAVLQPSASPLPTQTPTAVVTEVSQPAPTVQPSAPSPSAMTDAVPPTSNVPNLFQDSVSPEAYDMMGKDEAGKAIQQKLALASKCPTNHKFTLSAYKDASEYLLNKTQGSELARDSARKLLSKGYELSANTEVFGNVTQTGKNIARDYAYVLVKDGGEENIVRAAKAISLADKTDRTVAGLGKMIESIRPGLIGQMAARPLTAGM